MVCRNENDSELDAGSPSELPYYELPGKSTTSSSMDKSNDSASQSDTTPASASSLNCPRETSSPPHSPVSSDSPPLSPLYESYSLSPLSPVATGSTSLPSSATSSSSYPAAIGSSLPPPVTTGSATGSSSCLPVETGSSSSCPIATPGLSSLSPAATSCVKDSSCLLPWDSCSNSDHNEEGLFTLFKESLSPQQITLVWKLSGSDFESAFECLSSGPTLDSLLQVQNTQYIGKQPIKVYVDMDDKWADLVAEYKTPGLDLCRPIRIILDGAPAIDQGGMRREIFTDVFLSFAENQHVRLFDGVLTCLRPLYSAEAQSSGLFKVLGQMVAHSISMDGVGFPYLSPTCYWYIVEGEDRALQFVEEGDVGADVFHLVKEVNFFCHSPSYFCFNFCLLLFFR